ncbi:esterase-like activity of phytase family protein [Patulibacter defluvii]|uniref:esterase-like activity of phytase family protein n=1 Tax=Patulibacter defluvii TaxID=3095358 RepID=UPI002A75F8C1|nr:esterase-like activity of phytase family protein [Patulibacter sp. DM4]
MRSLPRPRPLPLAAAVLALAAVPAVPAVAVGAPADHRPDHRPDGERPAAAPTLLARATLSATLYLPGPPSGAALGSAPINGVTPPFPGQPIPGFSGVLATRGGDVLGLADNGFGSKANSADYLLQLDRVRPRWRTRAGGEGSVRVIAPIRLSDPARRVPFPIVREGRQLTGADFDIESLQPGRAGSFWIGDEFGPYLLQVDGRGRLLRAPIPLPGVRSPQSAEVAAGAPATLPASGGFEAMAALPGGRTLLPITEKALTGDGDQQRRLIHEFDVRRARYTGRTWSYRTELPTTLVADAQALDRQRLLVLERDDFEGAKALVKKLFVVDLRRTNPDGSLVKTEVADLLRLRDPGVTVATPGSFGLGDPFSFALQSVESVLPLGGGRVLVANDNNFPFSNGRVAGRPDDTELIVVDVPALRER